VTATQARPGPDMTTLPTTAGDRAGTVPGRPVPASWPGTAQGRTEVRELLAREQFAAGSSARTERMRLENLSLLLDWLEEQPGATWQGRWAASGADAAGASWRDGLAMWMEGKGLPSGGGRGPWPRRC